MPNNQTPEGMTFNDLPRAMSVVLSKVESMEHTLSNIREEIKKVKVNVQSEHIPMDVDQACEFLCVKKPTMYYYLQNNKIPAVRNGKKYTFFKDELIKWVESGRKIVKHDEEPSFEEINAILSKRTRKKRG